ncbi:MAG: thioredoxin [Proteobacteria bacterium]|nr:thioredoxin [Pseudomonadota bacterium]
MSLHAVDVDARNFNQEVLEASRDVPVVIDFWAPWCGPCKVLKPMLEKLAAEYAGKFKLVKINSDESIDLAREFNVRSIPDVRAIRNGKQVGAFVGALPLPQLRAFIDKLIPSASETERVRAGELRAAGDAASAIAAYRKALALDPANDLARIELAELLLEHKEADAADALLAAVKPDVDTDDRVETLRQGVAFVRSGQSGPGEAELAGRIAASPGDLDSRLRLANLYAGGRRYREALEQLLEIILRDKAFQDGAARKQMVAIFGLAASDGDLVSEYRRKLASALY